VSRRWIFVKNCQSPVRTLYLSSSQKPGNPSTFELILAFLFTLTQQRPDRSPQTYCPCTDEHNNQPGSNLFLLLSDPTRRPPPPHRSLDRQGLHRTSFSYLSDASSGNFWIHSRRTSTGLRSSQGGRHERTRGRVRRQGLHQAGLRDCQDQDGGRGFEGLGSRAGGEECGRKCEEYGVGGRTMRGRTMGTGWRMEMIRVNSRLEWFVRYRV
jgi:hypothetical protein